VTNESSKTGAAAFTARGGKHSQLSNVIKVGSELYLDASSAHRAWIHARQQSWRAS